jgi:hypothetical protein
VKARKIKKLDPEAPLRANAARIVRVRLDEVRSFGADALEPGNAEAQHDMRIAAKRLRYVLEVTEGCFASDATRARKAAKELQTLLGDIHDCDVMLPRVESQVRRLQSEDARSVLLRADGSKELDPRLAEGAPNRRRYGGLGLLAIHLRARRALLFERFRDLWQSEASKGTWAALERSLDAAG